MRSDNTINRAAMAYRIADQFVYVAGAALLCVLAYGVSLF